MSPASSRLRWLSLLLIVGAGCATSSLSGFDEPEFPAVIARYQTLEGIKVLALATEANGRFAWGVVAKMESEADALDGALGRCRRAARSGGMRATCYAFAVGDDPASDTVRSCAARRLPSRRCHMQRQHQGKLRK
ncbi:MAG: hypothetical protein GY723_17260 [bacterium]|nr:hypothetical protein [bacterium]MCP5065876.1 hypothetical protein [bacterium]